MKNLFVLFTLSIFLLANGSLQAKNDATPVLAEALDTTPAPSNVFVHISLKLKVLKRTAQGADAEIVGIRLGKKNASSKGIFTGQMKLEGKQLIIKLDKTDKNIRSIKMPKGLKLTEGQTEKLGATGQVVMSGGTTMLQPQSDSLLQFEIQD